VRIAVLCLVATLATGCASMAALDRSVYTTVKGAKALGDGACDAGLRTPAQCQAFAAALVPTLETAKLFSQGVEQYDLSALPALVDALTQLRTAFVALMPDARETADHLWALIAQIKAKAR